ncbi:MAG: sulfur transferase domain-containing protein [Oculatellaceae cyanobacterium bins.114]|nr:sulfur transferase domain-containing protein [Oculatellaceae cyanobacterium bins.114]
MVNNTKKVNDDYSIAGQVTPEQLQQAADEGFKSVLNVRSPDESGVLVDEQQQANASGLEYANVPLSNTHLDTSKVAQAIEALGDLPKPVLIHCGAGARAGGIALIATAIQEGLTLEELTVKAEEIGLNLDQPHLKKFVEEQYLEKKEE